LRQLVSITGMAATLYAKCDCEHCGNHIAFPAGLAGSVIVCPHCQQQTTLNLGAPKSAPAPGELTGAEIINAFGPPVSRTRVSVFYQAGLLLVAVFMVMLPLVYFGLIGLGGYGLYYFVAHFSWLVPAGRIGTRLFLAKLVLFVLVLALGLIVLFFLVKPLFARRPKTAQPLTMDPGEERVLHAFIARVCESVGAPLPGRIELNCELNAAAGYREGMKSVFSNDLVLIIGLPLVAGLSVQELAGVIAHEFGHFTQGFGMRLSYLVRRINFWFARLCYERDTWDERLAETAENPNDGGAMLVAGAVQFFIGVTRLPLMALMYLGQGVSCYLMRQMEYDADSYEIKVAGSAAMERTTLKFCAHREVMKRTYKEIRSAWNTSRKLPDNFPAFFAFQESMLPVAIKARIADRAGLSRTRMFSTHPSDGDRIRQARKAGATGIFQLQRPARDLFRDFDALARQFTMLHYHTELELDCDASNLRGLEFYTRPAAT
jgi:Zn-dependent protease with chaperone function